MATGQESALIARAEEPHRSYTKPKRVTESNKHLFPKSFQGSGLGTPIFHLGSGGGQDNFSKINTLTSLNLENTFCKNLQKVHLLKICVYIEVNKK